MDKSNISIKIGSKIFELALLDVKYDADPMGNHNDHFATFTVRLPRSYEKEFKHSVAKQLYKLYRKKSEKDA